MTRSVVSHDEPETMAEDYIRLKWVSKNKEVDYWLEDKNNSNESDKL